MTNIRLTYLDIIAEEVSHDTPYDVEADVCPNLLTLMRFLYLACPMWE